MIFIPGYLISLITFPGIIIHEFAHQLMCNYFKVSVYEVCYFSLRNPAGYVIHEEPKNWVQHLLIAISPFFINTLIGGLIAAPSAIHVFKFSNNMPTISDAFLIWLGLSIVMHAIPSTKDAESVLKSTLGNKTSLLAKLCIFPIVGIIYLLALGSIFWIDLIYGVAVILTLPELLIMLFS